MKILVLGFGNASGRYKPPSTHCENYISRNMEGHEIMTFGYNDGVDIVINPEDEFERVVEQLPEGWNPDLCLLWLLEWNLLPRGIERAPFPTAACIFDWDYDVPYAKTCMESVDLTIVTGETDKRAVEKVGANNVEVYYFAGAMKEFINPQPKKIKERKYDILYSTWIDDSSQPERSRWISKFCSLSDKYKVHIEGHLSYAEYLALLNDSKLVFSYNRHGSMAVRVTDAGTQGTVVLDSGEGTSRHFIPDEEYISISENNFEAQIDRYLSDEESLQKMSDKFHLKVTEQYEASHRFVELLELAHEKLKGKNPNRAFNKLKDSDQCTRRGELYYYSYFAGAPGVFFLNMDSKLLELAIKEFQRAVDIEPSPRNMTNIAIAKAAYGFSVQKNKIMDSVGNEVISTLENVISENPSYVLAYFNLGMFYFRLGDLNNAMDLFRKAKDKLEYSSSDIDPWCLHNRDYGMFNQMLRRQINKNTVMSCVGNGRDGLKKIRDLYHAITFYYIALIEDENGYVYRSLEILSEAYNLYPDSGPIIKMLASLLSLLGFKDESLAMYKKSTRLFPSDMQMRIEYILLLYLYDDDMEVVKELRDTLKTTKTVVHVRDSSNELKEILEDFSRFKIGPYQRYDSTLEARFFNWLDILFSYLRKDPKNFDLVTRIAGIFNEMGRSDKIFELINDYLSCPSEMNCSENDNYSYLIDVCTYLKEKTETDDNVYEQKLKELEFSLIH